MNFTQFDFRCLKSLSLTAALLCFALNAPGAQAQSARPMIAVAPVATSTKPVVTHFVDISQDTSRKCELRLRRDKPMDDAEMVRQIQNYRACKADRLLHANDVWKWAG